MPKVKKRGKNKDNNRRAKKKISILSTEKIEYVDWKDANLLRRFMSERAKIRARRVTGNNAQQQKLVADGCHDVEAARVEGHCGGVLADGRLVAHLILLLGVVPDKDIAVRARHDQLLPQASVHASDLLVMEGAMHILTLG